MLTSSRRRAVTLLAALALAAPLAACGDDDSSPSAERDTDDDVSFNGCDEVECEGEIDGAAYEIALPDQWNGTLLIYSHGYRNADEAPPEFEEVRTTAEPAPGWPENKEVGEALLEEGYALAGSAYASNGWAVEDGVKAGEDLHDFFVEEVGEPNRVYVWGDSLGGLITTLLAEKHPDWVSGAMPLCGAVAGPNPNLDLALDVGYAVKTFFYPQLKLSGFDSWEDAVANWEGAAAALQTQAADVTNGVPKVLLAAAIVDAPNQTRTYDGASIESQVRGYAESVLTALGFSTFGRYEVEQRVGGNPSDNSGADYAARIDEGERGLIETVSPGATDKLLAQLADGERVSADADARQAFADTGTPTGGLGDPTISLHTAADPLVLVQNQSLYRERYLTSQDATADFIQLYTTPPDSWAPEEGAPYGAGHCNFTPESRVAVVELMDGWVKTGAYPGTSAVTEAFGTESGYAPLFRPEAWPNPDAQ